MTQITTFPLERGKLDELKRYHLSENWPVVYLQENGKEMYIGQTTNLYNRTKTHLENPERQKLKTIHVVTDEEFNLSANYDFEAQLIQYVAADGKFTLQNGNGGLVNHNYFDKERYESKLKHIWDKMRERGLARQTLDQIRNTDFFKFSPYKALTEDQLEVAQKIEADLKQTKTRSYIVNGSAGTGKTILALYLLKHLREMKETEHLKIALVVSMVGLRKTLQRVVKRIPGLGMSAIIGPSDVAKQEYDVLIVDEAHRLRRRVNLTNFKSYDDTNTALGLPKEATQLDWILKRSRQQILFYDKFQNVMPGDVRAADFTALDATEYRLQSQLRVKGGNNYLQFIDDLFAIKRTSLKSSEYEFKIYDSIQELIADIKKQDAKHTLARVVAGYAWDWATARGKADYDIEIDGLRMVWNGTNVDWVNSKNALNEVGCIHTIQGYDLNYAGVIIGPEVSYDERTNSIVVDKAKYVDQNGRRGIAHPEELKQYVINIYKTLLTRGILGTYVYICDAKLKAKFRELMGEEMWNHADGPTVSPITVQMVRVPIVGCAPCGNPLLGEENIEGYIEVEKTKIHSGYKYFAVRATGDSMNKKGIQDGDLLLCRQQEKAETGDRVVALLGGENVTIKEYGPRIDGVRQLLPRSTNSRHLPITPGEGDSVQGIVQEVIRGVGN